MRNILFVLVLASIGSLQTFAQNNNAQANVGTTASDINWENFELEMEGTESDWKFHTDSKSKTLFIDFEALGGNMSKLILKDARQDVVLTDNQLFDLPANTIYEVNLSKLEKGIYSIELHTFNSIIKEEVVIQ